MKRLRRLAPVGLAALSALLPTPALAIDETIVYGINYFNGAGQCASGASHAPWHTDSATAFKLPFDTYILGGDWDESYSRNNSAAHGSYFEDASKSSTAEDTLSNYGADNVDVIYIHTHGGHSTSPAFSSLSMGNSSYDCSADTDDDMLFGNEEAGGDLDIAVIKACQSGDYDTWLNGGYRQNFTNTTSTFTVWNAFHGDSSCGSGVDNYVSDYAWGSFENGVGENWIDEAYNPAFWWWETDDCPISLVMGSSATVRTHMYEWGGFRDREDTGSKTGSTYFRISGCAPTSGRVLP